MNTILSDMDSRIRMWFGRFPNTVDLTDAQIQAFAQQMVDLNRSGRRVIVRLASEVQHATKNSFQGFC